MTALTDWLTQARGLVTVATDGPWEAADGMVWTAETPPTGVARYLWAQSDYECSLTRFDVREAIATALGVSEP